MNSHSLSNLKSSLLQKNPHKRETNVQELDGSGKIFEIKFPNSLKTAEIPLQ